MSVTEQRRPSARDSSEQAVGSLLHHPAQRSAGFHLRLHARDQLVKARVVDQLRPPFIEQHGFEKDAKGLAASIGIGSVDRGDER